MVLRATYKPCNGLWSHDYMPGNMLDHNNQSTIVHDFEHIGDIKLVNNHSPDKINCTCTWAKL